MNNHVVYVLVDHEIEADRLIGVYSTREKAEEISKIGLEGGRFDGPEVVECILNETSGFLID